MSTELLKVREQIVKDLKVARGEEYDNLIENLVKIERLNLEEIRVADETRMKVFQKKKDIWDVALRHGLTALGIGVTTFTTIFLFREGMYFEKEDTFRSTTMRNFMSKNTLKLK